MAKLVFLLCALVFVAAIHASDVPSQSTERGERTVAVKYARHKMNKKFRDAKEKFEVTKKKIDELLKDALVEVKAKAKDGKELALKFGKKLKKALRQMVKEIGKSLKSVTKCAKVQLQQNFTMGVAKFINNMPMMKKN